MMKTMPKYPKPIQASDLHYPKYNPKVIDHVHHTFDMHYVESIGGWLIATLLIAKQSARSYSAVGARANRSYAVCVSGPNVGKFYRVGLGPHVTHSVTVYVRESREVAFKELLDLKKSGEVHANETRDRISTRRMNTANRRSSWGF